MAVTWDWSRNTTPPNPCVHFQDTLRPTPKALEGLDKSEMSKVKPDDEDKIADIIMALTHRIRNLNKDARDPPSRTSSYHNGPALLNKVTLSH